MPEVCAPSLYPNLEEASCIEVNEQAIKGIRERVGRGMAKFVQDYSDWQAQAMFVSLPELYVLTVTRN